jgi:UDP-N-acetyl-D-mannosaminuronate dehydrogenase
MANISNSYDNHIENRGKNQSHRLGYVGLPIAVSFSRKVDVIVFDS